MSRVWPTYPNSRYPGFGEGHPEDRCPDCEVPVCDHTWRHPLVMLGHAARVLVWR